MRPRGSILGSTGLSSVTYSRRQGMGCGTGWGWVGRKGGKRQGLGGVSEINHLILHWKLRFIFFLNMNIKVD